MSKYTRAVLVATALAAVIAPAAGSAATTSHATAHARHAVKKKKKKKHVKKVPPHTYDIVYSGSGSYVRHVDGTSSHAEQQASFSWDVGYRVVINPRTKSAISTSARPKSSSGGGYWSSSDYDPNASPPQDCQESGGLTLAPKGGLSGSYDSSGDAFLTLVPGAGDFLTLGGTSGTGPCDTTDFWKTWIVETSGVGQSAGQQIDPLTASIGLRPSDLRSSKVVVPVTNASTESLSPPAGCGTGCRQAFTWNGKVTVTPVK